MIVRSPEVAISLVSKAAKYDLLRLLTQSDNQYKQANLN